MGADRPNVVALRALGLGDVLTAVPAFRALARAYPDHGHVFAGPAPLAPLAALAGFDEHVDVTSLDDRIADLPPPELAVNLHGHGPESHRLLLATRPRTFLAFRHPDVPESLDGPSWDDDEHEVERWCRLLASAGIDADGSDLGVRLSTSSSSVVRGATLIHPGAASAARRWPIERWAEIARRELAEDRTVVVTGGPDERALAEELSRRAGIPDEDVFAGRTDVLGLAELVAAADVVLCGDTGVAHLATALGTPSVVLFGPTSPAAWGPPAGSERHRVLWAGVLGDPHGDRPSEGLLRIGVGDVVRELDDLRERRVRPPDSRARASAGARPRRT